MPPPHRYIIIYSIDRLRVSSFFLGVVLLVLLPACTLATPNETPPSLVPRVTDTLLPTIGYATLRPDELPTQAATPLHSSHDELLALLSEVESDRLIIHVDALQNFYTRNINAISSSLNRGINAAFVYIQSQFQTIQTHSQGRFITTEQAFSVTWNGIRSTPKNIIGIIPGIESGAGVIVIGAHYDSRNADPKDATHYAPGANDNGSGVAALIELARILSARQHRATILFVAFSAEEEGRLGSIAVVKDYFQAQHIDVTAMLDLDIIGSSTDGQGRVNNKQIRLFSEGPDGSPSRQLSRSINLIGLDYMPGMEIVIQESDDRTGSYGDHLSFSAAGYAAVRFTEMNEEPQRRHTERDTIDDVQADYLVSSTQTILTVVTVLADGPQPPRNMTLRDNGDGTRKLVWEPMPNATSYVVAIRPPGLAAYQQFEVRDNFVDWAGFVPERTVALAIASKDASGLIGSFSAEYLITP